VSEPRICFVSESFYPYIGGMESQARLHIRGLHRRGYATTILTLRHQRAWPIHEELDGAAVVRVAGTLLDLRARLPRFARRPLYLLSVVLLAQTLWRYRHQYDLVHVYQLTIVATFSALVCLLARKRMVVGVRGIGAGGSAANSCASGPASLVAIARRGHVKVSPPVGGELAQLWQFGKPAVQVTCILLRLVDAVVLVLSTRSIAHLTTCGYGALPMLLVPNGVDTERFTPLATADPGPKAARADSTGVVVCVARLAPVKGVDVLLHAWRLVSERAPWARLVLVGGGPLQPPLERLSVDLELQACVEFAGEQSDALPYLRRAAIAVLPSHGEGLSNALLEAMACGLPCVATRVSGSEDVIQQGVNGLLVEPGDARALADALLTLLCDPALALSYGHTARVTIERHYSHERITDQYVELYRQLIDARRGPARRAQLSIDR
jgi:glycosyltransferase involved in cell wall biosynthesis